MCTLIVNWQPGKYIIGANRDEEKYRKCDDEWKNRGNFYAPQDLRGGTWIGINEQGIFSAITNAPTIADPHHSNSIEKKSRGLLVTTALNNTTIYSAINSVIMLITCNYFRGFNLIIGNYEELWLISSGGNRSAKIESLYGKNIITADSAPVYNHMLVERQSNHRLDYIAKNIYSPYKENLYINDVSKMYEILSYTADGYVDNAVCVKVDDTSNHLTRSSSIIVGDLEKGIDASTIYWTDQPPDECSIENWNILKL